MYTTERERKLSEMTSFERSKYLYKKYWDCPITTEKYRVQVKENYKLWYGSDDLKAIFGDCDSWNSH